MPPSANVTVHFLDGTSTQRSGGNPPPGYEFCPSDVCRVVFQSAKSKKNIVCAVFRVFEWTFHLLSVAKMRVKRQNFLEV